MDSTDKLRPLYLLKLLKEETDEDHTLSTTQLMPINPVIILVAVALHSIEKQLDNIADMEKQILSFLEQEKQSEIEADVEMLSSMITKYKLNWDNEHYVASNHKLALDIQRTARKNMLSYQKNVGDILQSRKLLVGQSKVNSALNDLIKKFKYRYLTHWAFYPELNDQYRHWFIALLNQMRLLTKKT